MTIWYAKYKETATGEEIDGDEIRIFMDWEEEKVAWAMLGDERPRYARMIKGKDGKGGSIVTYLDSQLTPVGNPLTQEEIDASNPRKVVA